MLENGILAPKLDEYCDGERKMSNKHGKPNNLYAREEMSPDEEAPESLEFESRNELETKLNEADAQITEYKNQALRLQAEMQNLQRRVEKDISNAHRYALEKFVNELLPVADSLEQGLAIQVGDNEFARKIHEGLEMTYKLFLKTLEKFSIKQIDPMGQPFNPEQQQAISMQEDPKVPANTVVQVLQKGYVLHDRLVRPALVVVSK